MDYIHRLTVVTTFHAPPVHLSEATMASPNPTLPSYLPVDLSPHWPSCFPLDSTFHRNRPDLTTQLTLRSPGGLVPSLLPRPDNHDTLLFAHLAHANENLSLGTGGTHTDPLLVSSCRRRPYFVECHTLVLHVSDERVESAYCLWIEILFKDPSSTRRQCCAKP